MKTCQGCDTNIDHLSNRAKWCSAACRIRNTYDRTTPKRELECFQCGAVFKGNGNSKYCSRYCRASGRLREQEYDPDKRREYMRLYQQRNKRERIPEEVRQRIFMRDKLICQICGEICDGTDKLDPRMPSIDHITPWIETQDDSEENLRTVHLECNRRRRWV